MKCQNPFSLKKKHTKCKLSSAAIVMSSLRVYAFAISENIDQPVYPCNLIGTFGFRHQILHCPVFRYCEQQTTKVLSDCANALLRFSYAFGPSYCLTRSKFILVLPQLIYYIRNRISEFYFIVNNRIDIQNTNRRQINQCLNACNSSGFGISYPLTVIQFAV